MYYSKNVRNGGIILQSLHSKENKHIWQKTVVGMG